MGDEAILVFNQEAAVSASLFQFGDKLKDVFTQIKASTTHGKIQRQRIFLKVKEKLDEEIELVKTQKDEMLLAQEKIRKQQARERELAEKQRAADEARKKREQDQ